MDVFVLCLHRHCSAVGTHYKFFSLKRLLWTYLHVPFFCSLCKLDIAILHFLYYFTAVKFQCICCYHTLVLSAVFFWQNPSKISDCCSFSNSKALCAKLSGKGSSCSVFFVRELISNFLHSNLLPLFDLWLQMSLHFRILADFVQMAGSSTIVEDKQMSRAAQDACQKLTEAVNVIVGWQLEQTTWLKRTLVVKHDSNGKLHI